jgi:hypothetical protein
LHLLLIPRAEKKELSRISHNSSSTLTADEDDIFDDSFINEIDSIRLNQDLEAVSVSTQTEEDSMKSEQTCRF